MNAPCPRCGKRNTSPLTGYAHLCHDCNRHFGFADPQQVIEAANAVRKLHFYVGGAFGPSFEIFLSATRFKVTATDAAPCIFRGSDAGFSHTPTRFRRIIRRLFRHYHLKDWASDYSDSDTLDGTQWELTLFLRDKRKMTFCGSNAYPPHYRKLLHLLAPYFHARGLSFETDL